jgi:hypothetical protein
MVGAMLFAGGMTGRVARADVTLSGPSFPVGNLQFIIPSKWKIEMVESPARGGQWHVPPLHGQGDGGEVVVFYFGPGIGGSAKENVEAWVGTMFNAEGPPAAYEIKKHLTGGFKISEVVMFGTYNQAVSLAGIPPEPKSNYGLLGAVIENAEGNIYWRFTGPEALITANLPLFNKVIDSVKTQEKSP